MDLAQGLLRGVDSLGRLSTAQAELVVDLPHSVAEVDGDWLVFNRKDLIDPSLCSEAVQLHMREDGEVEVVWRWRPPDCVKATMLGAVLPMAEGRKVLAFGSGGALYFLDADDSILFEDHLPLGLVYGQPDWIAEVSGL